ncbi:hypothetical protein B484DRAFT_429265, partial [Ochromonadaceae sp. CCMP2298]
DDEGVDEEDDEEEVEGPKLRGVMHKHASKFSVSAAAKAVEAEREGRRAALARSYVYPDVPLIRAVLKTMWNLLHTAHSGAGGGGSGGDGGSDLRLQMAVWLKEAEVGPPTLPTPPALPAPPAPAPESHSRNSQVQGQVQGGTVRLSRVARKDQVVGFYYSLLTTDAEDA